MTSVDAALTDAPWPGGGPASTLVRIESGGLAILRPGAVTAERLTEAGFRIVT